MTSNISKLSDRDLDTLSSALRSGRLPIPYSVPMTRPYVAGGIVEEVVKDLEALANHGYEGAQIAILIDAMRQERSNSKRLDEIIELVTTGPEAPGTTNRDTSVVVRDLFRQANESVVIVGYAIYQGQMVFESLANRMNEVRNLNVTMYLNLPPIKGTEVESIIVHRFMKDLKNKHWPENCRLPTVFYDPRSVDTDRSKRASLHAKCIVVDGKETFVSSANFTERAQYRNIEVGVRLSSERISSQLSRHFASLVENGDLKQANE